METQGYYGSGNTPCTIFEHQGWYCVEGSVNVNRTDEEITLGTNVEELSDYDMFTAGNPINSLDELIEIIES